MYFVEMILEMKLQSRNRENIRHNEITYLLRRRDSEVICCLLSTNWCSGQFVYQC